MLSDREKLEIAQVFDAVLEPRIVELKTDIAKGFVTILECCMEDLAKIMTTQNETVTDEIMSRMKRTREEAESAHRAAAAARTRIGF